MPPAPLVTVVIPTYQRCEQLGRTVDSVLAQHHPRVEIIVSDNASTDGTEELGQRYATEHPSLTYRRHPSNIGPTPNFESLRPLIAGDQFMFLGDDDWIDPGYVSACSDWLVQHPGTALVAGRTCNHRGEATDLEPLPITVDAPSGPDRLLDYYRQVRGNGVFYGVVPAELNHRVPPLRNVQGGDMLYVAALAYLGPVKTLDDVIVHRTMGGTSANLATVAAVLGLGWFEKSAPQLAMAYWVFHDTALDSPLYAELGRVRRFTLGAHAGWIVFRRFVPGAVVKFGRLVVAQLGDRWRSRRAPVEPSASPSVPASSGASS